MQQVHPPVLCFKCFDDEMKAMKILNLVQIPNGELRIANCNVRKCASATDATKICYETTPRVEGGKVGFLQYVTSLSTIFPGYLIVFDKTITRAHVASAGATGCAMLKIVTDITQLNGWLDVILRPEQMLLLNRLLIEERRPNGPRRASDSMRTEAEISYSDRFMEAMSEGRLIAPPDPDLFQNNRITFHEDLLPHQAQRRMRTHGRGGDVIIIDQTEFIGGRHMPPIMHVTNDGDDDDDEEEFLLAQEESLRQFQVEQQIAQTRPHIRRKIETAWESVLKESEPLVDGSTLPACIVCTANRASICLLPCSHQNMCDSCIREIWSRPDLKKECPICKEGVELIIRPFL